jgi:hypothetical protein
VAILIADVQDLFGISRTTRYVTSGCNANLEIAGLNILHVAQGDDDDVDYARKPALIGPY